MTSYTVNRTLSNGGPTGNIQIGVYGSDPKKMLMITWMDKQLSSDDVKKDLQASANINEGKDLREVDGGYCLDITSSDKVPGIQCEIGADGRTASAMLMPGTQEQALKLTQQVLTTWTA